MTGEGSAPPSEAKCGWMTWPPSAATKVCEGAAGVAVRCAPGLE